GIRVLVHPGDREQRPLTEAFQLADAAWVENDAGAGDEVLHRARDEYLADVGPGGDARADRDGQPCELAVDDVALAGVHSHADAEAEGADGVADRAAAADRPRGPGTGGATPPPPRGADRPAGEARAPPPDRRVVLGEQRRPGAARLHRHRRRVDEVGEEDGGEDAAAFERPLLPRFDDEL